MTVTKGRSPNYPRLPLVEALDRLKQVYAAIHTYPADKEAIIESLGYSGMSGRALTVLGTLRRYGLLRSEAKGQLRVSDEAVSILELPKGTPERLEALKEAAFTPGLFSELHNEFPDRLPNDSALKHYLIKKGFMPKAAAGIIPVYRANLELVEEETSGYNQPMPTAESSPDAISTRFRPTSQANVVEANKKFLPQWVYNFRLSRDTEATVTFIGGEVTQEAVDKLSELLEVQKDTFPTKAELEKEGEPEA